jgi:hypothetical protein
MSRYCTRNTSELIWTTRSMVQKSVQRLIWVRSIWGRRSVQFFQSIRRQTKSGMSVVPCVAHHRHNHWQWLKVNITLIQTKANKTFPLLLYFSFFFLRAIVVRGPWGIFEVRFRKYIKNDPFCFYVVAQLVETLCYKPEDRKFESRKDNRMFFNLSNNSSRIMTLRLAQSLTERNTRKCFWGVERDQRLSLTSHHRLWADCLDKLLQPYSLHGLRW